MNNPLVYVDEDGEIIEWIIGGLLIGAYIGGSKKGGSWNPAKWEGNWWQGALWGAGIGALTGGIVGSVWAAGGTIKIGASLFGKEIPLLTLTKAGAETGGMVTLGIGGATAATSIASYTIGHRKETAEEKIQRIYNSNDLSLAISGSGSTAISEMYYSKTYGTWMGKNYKIYSQTWSGNRYTGGKNKYGKKMSNYFRFLGYGISAYSAYDIDKKRINEDIGWIEWSIEQVSNAFSTFGGQIGAAWGIGWELGRSVVNSEMYQEWKFNLFYDIWERKYGKPSSSNEWMWNYFYKNYKP